MGAVRSKGNNALKGMGSGIQERFLKERDL